MLFELLLRDTYNPETVKAESRFIRGKEGENGHTLFDENSFYLNDEKVLKNGDIAIPLKLD